MLYVIEICCENGFFKRLVFDSESERDFDYDEISRYFGAKDVIRKKTYKEVEE